MIDRPLAATAAVHACLAVAFALWLLVDAPPVLGVHPAAKPLKFAVSIAVFLASIAIVLPAMTLAPATRAALAWTFSVTMVVEIVAITVQAARGVPSHFNARAPLDAVMSNAMLAAIVVASAAMLGLAIVATARPLTVSSPLVATAWRAGLWLLLGAVITGFAMGSRMQHSIGGVDGGPGWPVVNWSRSHGDLRVAHFLSMHALQVFPLVGVVLARVPAPPIARWAALIACIAAHASLVGWAAWRAFAGRPAW